jgi:hypothetical protein
MNKTLNEQRCKMEKVEAAVTRMKKEFKQIMDWKKLPLASPHSKPPSCGNANKRLKGISKEKDKEEVKRRKQIKQVKSSFEGGIIFDQRSKSQSPGSSAILSSRIKSRDSSMKTSINSRCKFLFQ